MGARRFQKWPRMSPPFLSRSFSPASLCLARALSCKKDANGCDDDFDTYKHPV